MAHPNEEHLRKANDALNGGDMDAFIGAHAPDVVFHYQGSSPLAGDHHGREEMGAMFGKFVGMLDVPPQADVHDCLANDEHGVLMVVQHLTRGGETIDVPANVDFHFRDGLVSEVWFSALDQAALDDFLA